MLHVATASVRLLTSGSYCEVLCKMLLSIAISCDLIRERWLLRRSSNSQAVLPALERTVTKAADLYHVLAYVHSYTSQGFEHAHFQQAFLVVGEAVLHSRAL